MTEPTHSTRELILEAAHTLILRQGYHGTSIRQVAQAVGITPGAIYNHYKNKEALFVELLSERIPQRFLLQTLSAVEGEDAEDLVHVAAQSLRYTLEDQFDNLRLLFVEILEFQGRHIGGLARELMPQGVRFVEQLQQLDERVKPYPTMIILRALGGLFMSYAITMAFFDGVPGFEDDPADLAVMTDMILHGLLKSGS